MNERIKAVIIFIDKLIKTMTMVILIRKSRTHIFVYLIKYHYKAYIEFFGINFGNIIIINNDVKY